MKRYTIDHCYNVKTTVEVLAESEEEAKQKASVINLKIEDAYNIHLNEQEITESEEIGNLNEMIKEAGRIIREYKGEDPFEVESYPTITSTIWGGYDMEDVEDLVEDFYWDDVHEELGMIVNDNVEVLISELDEMEQYEVAKLIIESAERNASKE